MKIVFNAGECTRVAAAPPEAREPYEPRDGKPGQRFGRIRRTRQKPARPH